MNFFHQIFHFPRFKNLITWWKAQATFFFALSRFLDFERAQNEDDYGCFRFLMKKEWSVSDVSTFVLEKVGCGLDGQREHPWNSPRNSGEIFFGSNLFEQLWRKDFAILCSWGSNSKSKSWLLTHSHRWMCNSEKNGFTLSETLHFKVSKICQTF